MIKDSGNRTEFKSGAVRDIKTDNGRCDLLPLDIVGMLEGSPFLICIERFTTNRKIINLYSAVKQYIEEAYSGDRERAFLELSKHFREGAEKYGEGNWQKGIPIQSFIDSAVRHYLKWRHGDTDENHDRAVLWNIICCIWTVEHISEESKDNES